MNNKHFSYKRLFLTILVLLNSFAVLHISFSLMGGFTNIYNGTIGAVFRIVFEKFSSPILFSLAELLLIVSPLLIIVVLVAVIQSSRKTKQRIIAILLVLSVFVCSIYGLFVLTFAAGYSSDTIEQRSSLERNKVTKEQLIGAMEYLTEQLNEIISYVSYTQGEGTEMPYNWDLLICRLNDAYHDQAIADLVPSSFASYPKMIAFSEPMTYTHISGVYTFFTGEANVNVNYPDFIIPFTAAHEMSHQRGIAREDDANFMAFIVCEVSTDRYIRYSGLLNMYEYISNDLYKTSPNDYFSVYSHLDDRVKRELADYRAFFDKYADSEISSISNVVNNLYLSVQGTEGVISYDLVTELYIALLFERDILRKS